METIAGEGVITLAEQGMPKRLRHLYELYAQDARRLAYFLTNDLALAEDLVQEAFIRVARRLAFIRNDASFQAYLRKTVVNLVRMHYRRREVERRYVERQGHDVSEGEPAGEVVDRRMVREELARLPVRQRAAIALRFYFDLTDVQTADILGCSQGTVRSLISRGLASLRAALDEESQTEAGDKR